MLHWANSLADDEQTLCNKSVGYVLGETSDDVTAEGTGMFLLESDACPDCKDTLDGSPKESVDD